MSVKGLKMENNQKNDDIIPSSDLYRGNSIPKPLRIVWIIFLTWAILYLAKWMLPDLKIWISQ